MLLLLHTVIHSNLLLKNIKADFVLDVTDGVGRENCKNLPLFVISTETNSDCIMIPCFTFGSWPESSCSGSKYESHAWSDLYTKTLLDDSLFELKTKGLVWSGASHTSALRKNFLDIVPNIRITHPLLNLVVQDTIWSKTAVNYKDNEAQNCMNLWDACKFQQQIYLPGITYSSSFKYKLMCNSMVMAVLNGWLEWWYPVLNDSNVIILNNLQEDLIYSLTNVSVEKMKLLAYNARQVILNILSPVMIQCYWIGLLNSLAWGGKSGGIPIEDVLLMENNDLLLNTETLLTCS